jgi:hypothetical protein
MPHAFTPTAPRIRAMQIAVVAEGRGWRLLIDQHSAGRFERRQDALMCAVKITRLSKDEGIPVELLVHDPFGELTTAQELAA